VKGLGKREARRKYVENLVTLKLYGEENPDIIQTVSYLTCTASILWWVNISKVHDLIFDVCCDNSEGSKGVKLVCVHITDFIFGTKTCNRPYTSLQTCIKARLCLISAFRNDFRW